ncbi:MAG TPA: RecX family transcriptional regulator [Terriglobales bacterium]|nr:RecX family transcriptional regulator [Terriglobales bacterium]
MPLHRRKTYDQDSLYEYAVGALARKMRSVAELKRLLRQRLPETDESEAMVEAVITRLKDQKYLNDSAYAAAYSSYRRENEKFGRLRVVTDLKARGVHSDVITKAVAAAYAGADEEKLARDFLRRKRIKKPANAKDAARIFRALMRAGYTSRTIIRLLKQWDVEEEVLTALESEAAS